jgi:hypothetical protein
MCIPSVSWLCQPLADADGGAIEGDGSIFSLRQSVAVNRLVIMVLSHSDE